MHQEEYQSSWDIMKRRRSILNNVLEIWTGEEMYKEERDLYGR